MGKKNGIEAKPYLSEVSVDIKRTGASYRVTASAVMSTGVIAFTRSADVPALPGNVFQAAQDVADRLTAEVKAEVR